MATINGKKVLEFLVNGMDNPLPNWFKPFGHPYVTNSKEFVVLDAQFGSAGKDRNWPNDVIPLAYVPDNINCVLMDNENCVVISSQFSGCLMAAFTYKGSELALNKDQRYVCHIAVEDRANGKECETVFLKAIDKKEISNCIIFNPAAIVPIMQRKMFTEVADGLGYTVNFISDVYGLISSDNECFSFIVGKKKDSGRFHVLSVVKWASDGSVGLVYSINLNLNPLLEQPKAKTL